MTTPLTSPPAQSWRCLICGYVHPFPTPPDNCPVCGAARSEFEPATELPRPPTPPSARRWQCLVCNHVIPGDAPPESCPICGTGPDQFEPAASPAPLLPGAGQTLRVLIIGAGIAGISAAEAVRKASPGSSVTVLSSERVTPYYRLNLTRYLAGDIQDDSLPIHPADWYEANAIQLMLGASVESLDPARRTVLLPGGRELPFDRLILAMGSHAFVPPLPGAALPGVVTLRTAQDAQSILHAVQRGARCVVIGGGILGLETAGALARSRGGVTLLESHDWIMPRQLNRKAGRILKTRVEQIGVTLRENARTLAIAGGDHVSGVTLDTGETLPADLVILATGVRPDTHLARKAGLEVNRGIVVDNLLRTSHPDIFAAGDVAEHNGVLYGAWAPSQYQGTMAGLNALGGNSSFGGLPRANTLKVLGIDLVSIGQFEPEDGSFRVIDRERDGGLHHFVFHDGQMAGCILLGDSSAGAPAKHAIENRTDFSALLAGSPSVDDVLAQLGR